MSSTSNPVGFCNNCGFQLYSGQKFCPECGVKINSSNTTETTSPMKSSSTPPLLKGHGQQVSPKFTLQQGLVTFHMAHNGQRNFIVWLLDQQGNRVGLLVNKTGSFNGAKALGIQRAGLFVLDIQADGNWAVNITQ